MADALADIEPRLTGLAPQIGEQLRALRPDLHAWVLAAIRASMKDQGRSVTGGQGNGLELGVETAVDAFVEAVAEPARDLTRTWSVFHTLGRTEHREGHRVDALRAILTVGARGIWAFLTEHAGPARLSPDDLYVLAAALFGYIDTLAGAAAEGYLDEQRDAAHDWTRTRRRLFTLLVQSDPPAGAALHAAAEAARWPLPQSLAVVSIDGTDTDHLCRAVGTGAIATVIDDATRMIIPDPQLPGRLGKLNRALTGRRAALGPTVDLRQARHSYRLSHRALTLQHDAVLPDNTLLQCDSHLLTLLTAWEPGLADRLTAHTLTPLEHLRPAARRTLAETLYAWLRAQGQVIPTAKALNTHPQTIRYRLRNLRQLFGETLDDPETRLNLHIALRHDFHR